MDSLLTRYRNLTVLLLVLSAQLLLLGYQVKTNQDVRLIRVWAVTAVTPLARVLESMRSSTFRFVETYLLLVDVREDNRRLEEELGRLKRENQFLRAELATAERAQALAAFQERTPSRTVAARIIGTGTGATSRVVFVDRGSAEGVRAGMAVVTPDGVVGKVSASYPTASQVVLITDPSFAAGVISEHNRVQGTLRGTGQAFCRVDYLENEERVEVGEWFYTSGDDRLFPRGLPVGRVRSVEDGLTFKEVQVMPSGIGKGLEEVLIVLQGVHEPLPQTGEAPPAELLPPPSTEESAETEDSGLKRFVPGTDADRLRERYERVGEAQGHVFGHGLPGSRPPDFNLKPGEAVGSGAAGSPDASPQVHPPRQQTPGNDAAAPDP
jgi:rod shape-determining protein MreC